MRRGKNVKSSLGEKAQNEVAKWEYINFCDPNIAAARMSEFFYFLHFLKCLEIFFPSHFYFLQMFGNVFLLHIVQPVLEINDMEGLFCQLQIF